jgi:hypothetical protein
MLALHATDRCGDAERPADDLPQPNPHDWLTLEQAACELGVSVSTVRRRLRRGLLRNRIVPRKGGFAYRIYIEGSRHGREPELHGHAGHAASTPSPAPRDIVAFRRERQRARRATQRADLGRGLELPLERISESLIRALRLQGTMPATAGAGNGQTYERYRALVRKRRWWQF